MRILSLAATALALTAVPAAVNAQAANQANAQAQPAPRTMQVRIAPDTTVVSTDNPGNLTAPPASSMNKTYPVCTRTLQDNCQNPGEGGAPGRSRALNYWPGEPASSRR